MSALDLLPQYVLDQIEECRNPRSDRFPPVGLREDLRAIPDAETAGWTVKFPHDRWHNSAEFSRNGVTIWWSSVWRAKRDDAPFREKPRLYTTLAEAMLAESRTSADPYEAAARAAGWQSDETGIFHASRGAANGTGDPAEYADDWKEACEISGITAKAEGRADG